MGLIWARRAFGGLTGLVYGLMMCCINNRRRECGNIHRRLLPNREESTARSLVKLYHGRPLHGLIEVGFFMPVYKTVSPLGLEPRTHGLKGHCYAIELGGHHLTCTLAFVAPILSQAMAK